MLLKEKTEREELLRFLREFGVEEVSRRLLES